MKLSSDLAYDFPSYIRTRGAEYHRSGAVQIDKASETEVRARVRGARLYRIEIGCTAKELTLWCDCPYFDSTGPCKHVWATILAAEARGYLSEASLATRDRIYDYADSDVGDDEDFDDEESEDDFPIPIRSTIAALPPPPK